MPEVHVTLPWSCLVPDNDKYGVYKGKMILTAKYRRAKENGYLLSLVARKLSKVAGTLQGRLSVIGSLYEPDKRRRDLSNYAKLVQDCMQGAIYDDDSQLDHVEWKRGGIDKTNPRLELVISSLTPTAG